MNLVALPVAVPLLVAAILAACSEIMDRRVATVIASTTAAFILGVCCYLLHVSLDHPIVYWFGNWKPDGHHFPIGICFLADASGCAMAALVSLLVLAALVMSWCYFDSVRSLFHALMLVFLAAMCGLSLTGDIFNLFVWFELMTASAVTLCGYKADETGPLVGALSFAVTNTVGAFLSLSGVAMIYAWTGSLNFAGIAQGLASHPPPPAFLGVTFFLIVTGFLVKAAQFPFHFWLPDAHAVAPTPVCVLFSGIMVELGIFAIMRVYFGVFSASMAIHEDSLRCLLVTIGTCTALVGAISCFQQRHIKRLLAFSTISHSGLILLGLALLEPHALAGAGIYVLGHGMIKGSLFIVAGILLHRFGSIDEFDLHGKARGEIFTGLLFILGAAGLAGVPPFGTFFGAAAISEQANRLHFGWISAIIIIAEALTAGAVLRVAARVFFGLGSSAPPTRSSPEGRENRETDDTPGTPWTMWIPAALLLAGSIALACPPSFRAGAVHHAEAIIQSHLHMNVVLYGGPFVKVPQPTVGFPPSWWEEVLALAIGIFLAAAALFPKMPGARLMNAALDAIRNPLKAIQSGRIGDYIAWLALGVAAWGGWLALALR